MIRSNPLIPSYVLLAALMACQQQMPELSQADKDAVQATMDKYIQAAIAADWDMWGQTFAGDVFYSPPHLAPMTGRDAVVAWARTVPKIANFTVTTAEIKGHGDLAYARGTYELDLILPDGSSITENGSFLELHRRQADGTWPYTHLMYHSTDPLPAAPPPTNE